MTDVEWMIAPAVKLRDHDEILAIAKQSKFTRDYGHMMFSDEAMYEKGWIRMMMINGQIVGFTCVRHKVREPKTKLYFIAVRDGWKNARLGEALMEDLALNTPHKLIELDVDKKNEKVLPFYYRLGYELLHDQAIKGTAYRLEKDLT